MARKGRKRNMDAPRYPSGEVRHRDEDARLIAQLGRLGSLPELLAEIGRPEFGTQLAMLHARGLIVETQKRAGEMWAELVYRHRRVVMDGSSGHAAISKPERVSGRGTRTYEDDLIERTAKQYDSAYCSVVDSGRDGIKRLKAVNLLCIDNERLLHDQLLFAKAGLNLLAEHFGLTGVRRMHDGA